MSIAPLPQTLTDAVYQTTHALYFPRRLWETGRVLMQLDCKKTILIGVTLLASTIHVLFVNTFLAKGIFHSIEDVAFCNNTDRFSCISPMGNAGGWNTELLAEFLLLASIYWYAIREGEFYKVKELCSSIAYSGVENIEAEEEKHRLLKAYNEQRFFPEITLLLQESNSHSLHTQLTALSTQLAAVSVFSCLKRAPITISLVLRSIPATLFIFNALSSLTGDIGLSRTILEHQNELSETGHIGEWLANATLALFMASNLPRSWIHEGLFVIAKELFTENLKLSVNDPLLYNEMRKRAQEILLTIANRGSHPEGTSSYLPSFEQMRAILERNSSDA